MNIQGHERTRAIAGRCREIQATGSSVSNNVLARRYGVHRICRLGHFVAKFPHGIPAQAMVGRLDEIVP